MSEQTQTDLAKAISDEDTTKTKKLFFDADLIFLKVSDAEADQSDHLGALTTNLEEFDALVVFTSEQHAHEFVNQRAELFEEGEEVEGFPVTGEEILECLPAGFGLLVDPESEQTVVMRPEMVTALRTE